MLLASIGGMAVTSAVLALGLDYHYGVLSAAAIILFIVRCDREWLSLADLCKVSFSIGLGPIPFLLVSEVVPGPVSPLPFIGDLLIGYQAIPALASLSLSLNWVANFFIAILFLPLRDALSSPIDPGDPISERTGEGRVFYLFTGVCAVLGLLVWKGLGTPR